MFKKSIKRSKVVGSTVKEIIYRDGTKAIQVNGADIITTGKRGSININAASHTANKDTWNTIKRGYQNIVG